MATIESVFCDKFEARNKSYVDSLSNLNDMNPSKIQQNFNDTMLEVLNSYMKADFLWAGMSPASVPDDYTGEDGLSVKFTSMNAFLGISAITPEVTMDTNLTRDIKLGNIILPIAVNSVFAPLVIPLATGVPGIITTDFPSAADGIDWSNPDNFSESVFRRIREKCFKQIFDDIVDNFIPLELPAERTTTGVVYAGVATVTKLYYEIPN